MDCDRFGGQNLSLANWSGSGFFLSCALRQPVWWDRAARSCERKSAENHPQMPPSLGEDQGM